MSRRTAAFGSLSAAPADGAPASSGVAASPIAAVPSPAACPGAGAGRPLGTRGRRRRRGRRSTPPDGALPVGAFAAAGSVAAAVPSPASELSATGRGARRRRRRRLLGVGVSGSGLVGAPSAGSIGGEADGSRPIPSPGGSSEECGTGRFLGRHDGAWRAYHNPQSERAMIVGAADSPQWRVPTRSVQHTILPALLARVIE
jgi:hypothetical protein